MAKILGVGGVFIKANDPEKLYQWYEEKLGLTRTDNTCVLFFPDTKGASDKQDMLVWSLFDKESEYFAPSYQQQVMINYRVDDLDLYLAGLKAKDVTIDDKREDSEYGRFAWIYDLEGNKIELWEPPVRES